MTPGVRDSEEQAFARAMLAEPMSTIHRLAYADWLEEQGDTERAALVREAEGWECDVHGGIAAFGWAFSPYLLPPKGHLYFVSTNIHCPMECVASVGWHRPRYALVHVFPDGTTPGGGDNWAWLLSLARARGLVIPGLYAPEPTDPELET